MILPVQRVPRQLIVSKPKSMHGLLPGEHGRQIVRRLSSVPLRPDLPLETRYPFTVRGHYHIDESQIADVDRRTPNSIEEGTGRIAELQIDSEKSSWLGSSRFDGPWGNRERRGEYARVGPQSSFSVSRRDRRLGWLRFQYPVPLCSSESVIEGHTDRGSWTAIERLHRPPHRPRSACKPSALKLSFPIVPQSRTSTLLVLNIDARVFLAIACAPGTGSLGCEESAN